jgi:transcriptional regulator with XRE-family HTH domain
MKVKTTKPILFPKIAKVTRDARAKTKWSQTDISFKMGWKNGQFMSNIERGLCSIPSKYLMKFCEILQIPVEDVIQAMTDDYHASLWKEASLQSFKITASDSSHLVMEHQERRFHPVPMDSSEAV